MTPRIPLGRTTGPGSALCPRQGSATRGSPAIAAAYQRESRRGRGVPRGRSWSAAGGPQTAGGTDRLVLPADRAGPTAAPWSPTVPGSGEGTHHTGAGVVTLAAWAHQPAQSVLRPACGDRPSPIVRLPERRPIRERGLAPRHATPGSRNPDLVANNAEPGDRDRMNQRIEPRRRLRGVTITGSRDTDGRRLSHPAGPPGHTRPPGVPGKTS